MSDSSTYASDLYLEFSTLTDRSTEGIISFYEGNLSRLSSVDFNEFFEIYYTYCNALFTEGMYTKFLNRVDWLIEKSIEGDFWGPEGEDLYEQAIFQKTAALYNLRRTEEAIKIAIQLVRINPENSTYRRLVQRCSLHRYDQLMSSIRMMGVMVILASSVLIAYEMFFLSDAPVEQVNYLQSVRNLVFALGLIILIVAEMIHHGLSYFHVRRCLKSSKDDYRSR